MARTAPSGACASRDRALERAMVLEAVRRQQTTKRSADEQVHHARATR